jgi:Zn-dependent M28 family amino/carboxypeptidase
MSTKQKIATAILLSRMFFLAFSGVSHAQESQIHMSTIDQFKEEFKTVPCKDSERLNAVKALFEKLGAASTDIAIEKFKNVENVVIRKQGETDEKIVVGAHYDKVDNGCGAIDNWTGIVAIAHIYKTLKNYPLKKTVLFVAFGKEEKGLIGSQAMTNAFKKEDLPQYCGMINIDSLGVTNPQVPAHMSSDKMEKLAEEMAKKMNMPMSMNILEGGDSDSSSFNRKKIPALTISALPKNWISILHTTNDRPAQVNGGSVYLGYRLALAMLVKLSESPCDAYR